MADILAILIERDKANRNFGGVVPHLVEDGISILQYANDTILFMEHDFTKAKDLKLIFCYGKAKECKHEYA